MRGQAAISNTGGRGVKMMNAECRSRQLCRRGRGIASVWFAVVGLALVGLFGFVLDYARVAMIEHQMQVAADAAALTAAQFVTRDQSDARNRAIQVARQNMAGGQPVTLGANGGNADDGDIVLGTFNPY